MGRSARSRQTQSQPQRRRGSSARRARNKCELLLDQSRTFRDLENLFAALDAMENWKELADKAPRQVSLTSCIVKVLNRSRRSGDPRKDHRAWKTMFEQAYDTVEMTMQPLLNGWLQHPLNGMSRPSSDLLYLLTRVKNRCRSSGTWADTCSLSARSFVSLQHGIDLQRPSPQPRCATQEHGSGCHDCRRRFGSGCLLRCGRPDA